MWSMNKDSSFKSGKDRIMKTKSSNNTLYVITAIASVVVILLAAVGFTNVEAQKKQLIDQNMKSEKVTKQINEAVAKAKAGQTTIKNLIAQLDSYNEFYTGLTEYTAVSYTHLTLPTNSRV